MKHENNSGDNKNNEQWNYISVIFENYHYPFNDSRIIEDKEFRNEIYSNATQYTYKTKNMYRAGQILTIDQKQQGYSRVLVINPIVLKENINYDLHKIKELPVVY